MSKVSTDTEATTTDATTIYALNVNGTACNIDYGLIANGLYPDPMTLATEDTGMVHISDEMMMTLLSHLAAVSYTYDNDGTANSMGANITSPYVVPMMLALASSVANMHLTLTLDAANYDASTGAVTATNGTIGVTISAVTADDFDSANVSAVTVHELASVLPFNWSQMDPKANGSGGDSGGGGDVIGGGGSTK